MSQIRALVWKDLRVHARFAATYLCAWPIVMRVLIQAQHDLGLTKSPSMASAMVPTAISFSWLFAILLAQALIERERGKETFAWIRTLPASDLHIVLAKFAMVVVFGGLLAAGWSVAMLGIDLHLSPWQAVSIWLVWWAFGGVALFCQMLLSGRFAAGTPGLLAFGVSGVAFHVSQSPDAVISVTRVWNDPHAHVSLWLICVAVEVCAIAATYARFRRQDSYRLAE